jgi:hypothetical protein
VAPLECVGENFVVNLPKTQFQTQYASMNLLRKVRSAGIFLDKKSVKRRRVFTKEKVDEIGVG